MARPLHRAMSSGKGTCVYHRENKTLNRKSVTWGTVKLPVSGHEEGACLVCIKVIFCLLRSQVA